jgi:hypothetical protein
VASHWQYHHGTLQFCWAHFKRNLLGVLALAKTSEAQRLNSVFIEVIYLSELYENIPSRVFWRLCNGWRESIVRLFPLRERPSW